MAFSDGFTLVPPGPNVPSVVNALVEIPKGRRSKFEIDKATGLLKLDRYLYSSLMYPGDYGFVPQTLAEDGDPLDILVMVNEPTFSGCLIEARPIGLFKMTDKGFNDFKVLAVPNSDPIFADFHDLWRVPPHFLREVEHFFGTYKELEGEAGEDTVKTLGWESADKAKLEIQACIRRFKNAQQPKEQKQSAPSPAPKREPSVTVVETKPAVKMRKAKTTKHAAPSPKLKAKPKAKSKE